MKSDGISFAAYMAAQERRAQKLRIRALLAGSDERPAILNQLKDAEKELRFFRFVNNNIFTDCGDQVRIEHRAGRDRIANKGGNNEKIRHITEQP